MEFYHLNCCQYEYGYHQCLASQRLTLWFCAAEVLSGTVGFSTRQLVRTKTCLISPPCRDVWFLVLNKKDLLWVNVSLSQRKSTDLVTPTQSSVSTPLGTLREVGNRCCWAFKAALTNSWHHIHLSSTYFYSSLLFLNYLTCRSTSKHLFSWSTFFQ